MLPELDAVDMKMLRALQAHGRLSNVELAEQVGLSPSPCLRRLKHLEESGVIRAYAALLAPEKLGLGLQAYIRVTLDKTLQARQHFAQAVQDWGQVLGCYAMTGETDYLLFAFFRDMDDFSHFIFATLMAQTGVLDAKSSFVLHAIKQTTALPLPSLTAPQ